MPNKIKILHPEQAQKIAAGEVIERPSNVVKEILENSIDADASQISLFIENAGKKLIRIVDNGCGMSVDDAKLCFLPHATSKITRLEELEQINSFGFRGEALASISAVGRIILITKLEQLSEADSGTKIEFHDGSIQNTEPISCNSGTDIAIHDLFYNIPVRKKFLKQDETEWNLIQSIFQAFCLSHTSIHFKLFRDGKMILNAPIAKDLKTRITQIWGNNLSQNMLELTNRNNNEQWLNLSGYISNHNFWKYGKTHIFFFVNNRWVKNTELSKALFKGYLNVLPPDKSPAAFIFVSIDKTFVDVNCHPKKEEVRFLKPVTVQTRLQELIKLTLENNISAQISSNIHTQHYKHIAPDFSFKPNSFPNNDYKANFDYLDQSFNSIPKNLDISHIHNSLNTPSGDSSLSILQNQQNILNQGYENIDPINDKNEGLTQNNFKIIGQLFRTYIVAENNNELVIIDQHAAHERILYEKMLKNFEEMDGTKLLFPEILKLSESQINELLKHKDFILKQGIDFEIFGKEEIIIKTGPTKLSNTSLKELILELVSFIEENEHVDAEMFRKRLHEHTHSQLACKSAVKAGDELSLAQMESLLQSLQSTEKRFICVHGRPTTWSIKKLDLEKNFKRKN